MPRLTPLALLALAALSTSGCANSTHIRSAVGTVAPIDVNLRQWRYTSSRQTIRLQWAHIGPPVWIRRAADGGYYAVGLMVDASGWSPLGDGLSEYRPGRTHLIAVAYDAEGRVRRPTDELREDLAGMIAELRRVAW